MATNLEKLEFKAVKKALVILSKDLILVLRENPSYILRLFSSISYLKEFRKQFSAQYGNIQKIRVTDALQGLLVQSSPESRVLHYSQIF